MKSVTPYALGAAVIAVAAILFFLTQNTDTRVSNVTGTFERPKHIVVIDICTLRADHVGSYGYTRPTTPNLDAFAKDSVRFEDFWTQSNWCLPNFATMLTGARPNVHNLTYTNSHLSSTLTTLAQVLHDNGFATAGFSGSKYLVPGAYGLEKGFDTFENGFSTMADTSMPMSYRENQPNVDAWIASNKDKPFFLYVTIDDLHSPYMHAQNPKMFDPGYSGILDTVHADMSLDSVYNGAKTENIDAKTLEAVAALKNDPKAMEDLIARYDAGIVSVDEMAGELLDTLKKNAIWDDALIIITSHQGEQFGEHGLLGHAVGLYEPVMHVPTFIRYPGIKSENAHTNALAQRIDIPATILDSLGLLGANTQFTGSSLIPVLKDSSATGSKYIFADTKPTSVSNASGDSMQMYTVRDNEYKLIWSTYKKDGAYELYNLRNDPAETKNLVDSSPEEYKLLKDQLDQYVAHLQ